MIKFELSGRRKLHNKIIRIRRPEITLNNKKIERKKIMNNNITYENMFTEYPDIITVEALQNMLRIGRTSAYNMLKDGTIEAIKAGRNYIIHKAAVIKFVASIVS